MQETPVSMRKQIGFFGCRNAGKSSLVNAVTGQEVSVVSRVAGTTTDPVSKTMELLPMGPVVVIDTPGFDDEGTLGALRIRRTRQILDRCDVAVLVVDGERGIRPVDEELAGLIRERRIPFLTAVNKCDLLPEPLPRDDGRVYVSAATGAGVRELKERIAALGGREEEKTLAGDLFGAGDTVVLVCPIDESAPKGRLILPQQQLLREVLDLHGLAVVSRETELEKALAGLSGPPALVVTDSQAFAQVSRVVPEQIPLTSFSILMARLRGFLYTAVEGVTAIGRLRDGDRVLMAEGCTHHRQCNDIGTVKIPRWLREHTGKQLVFEHCSGKEFPEDLSGISLVVHCGGCMITAREVQVRMRQAQDQQVPFTNYGIAIAAMTGVLERSVRMLPDVHELLER